MTVERFRLASLVLFPLALVACHEAATEPHGDTPASTLASAAAGSWSPKPALPGSREMLAAAVVQNSAGQYVLYGIGGTSRAAESRVDAFNASTNTWSRKAPMPAPRYGTNGATAIAGRIYLSGGGGAAVTATRTMYVYTTTTNSWARRADLPVASSNGITAAIGGKVYVLTGFCGCATPTDGRLYRFDPATNTWTRRADAPHSHTGGVGGAIDGKFYVAWGGGDEGRNVDVYDPATNRWTTVLSVPYGQVAQTAVGSGSVWSAAGLVYNQSLLVIGGEDSEGTVPHTISYNPRTNSWTKLASLPLPRESAAAGRVRDASGRLQVVVVGGLYRTPSPDDDNLLFGESAAFTQ